ncbi:MAG: carbohydrate ABC transporter permease [Propionibacteriaceae bacterium]|jgi:raffinose/stachyose/melibiose transport system permease protein|nr:carbohydrate ABC transporter permease [Propionibacteriaceae bacterium]
MFEIRGISKKVIIQVVLLLMTIPFVLPLFEMVRGSFAGRGFHNYVVVWETGVVPTYFRNSAIIAATVIVIVYVLSMTAAFGFAKMKFAGKELYYWLMLAALTLPEVILLSPLFVTATQLRLYDTLFAVILPLAALQLPFAILLTRSFYDGIPNELIEASRIDGANIFQVFWHIMLPLTKPIASAVIVLTLINSWNSYLLPLVFLIDPSQQVVTLLPQFFVGEFTNDQTKILAAAVMTAVPEILAYILMQKNFERGMSAGALK